MAVDVVVSVLLCGLLGALMEMIDGRRVATAVYHWWGSRGRCSTVSLRCVQSTWHGRPSASCSTEFTAVLERIREATAAGKASGVKHLVELPGPRVLRIQDDDDETGQSLVPPPTLYLVDQREWFTLDDCTGIKLRMFSRTLTNGSARRESSSEQPGQQVHTLEVSSADQPGFAQEFIRATTCAYRQAAAARDNAQLHVFSYTGAEDGELHFSIYPFETTCSVESLHFDEKARLFEDIDAFASGKHAYAQRGRPHTLGICTHGPPGCGKTTFEKVLCKHLGRHMIIVDAATLRTQEELDELFFSTELGGKNVPYDRRVYVFPDVDRTGSVFLRETFRTLTAAAPGPTLLSEKASSATKALRDYRSVGTPLTLSKVLNVLDGVPERTGQIVVMSANHPERLDPALLRPGRMDKVIRFSRASCATVKRIVEQYFPGEEVDIPATVGRVLTPAEVIQNCTEARAAGEAVEMMSAGVPNP